MQNEVKEKCANIRINKHMEMSESMNLARFKLRWPNRPSEMRHFAGFPLILYLLIILNYSTFVNSLDIFVSRVGPEADFHEVTSGSLHIDEGRSKVHILLFYKTKIMYSGTHLFLRCVSEDHYSSNSSLVWTIKTTVRNNT